MISIYLTDDGKLRELEQIVPGAWVHLCAPTEEEVATVCAKLCVEPDLVRAALDEEERSRIDFEDGHMLVLVDTPTVEAQQGRGFVYSTLPLGIIMVDDVIITVSTRESTIITDFTEERIRGFWTFKRTRFILQLLHRNASRFLAYLKQIDKASMFVQTRLEASMRNQELLQMMKLEKSLVYFSTSLKGNEIVLEKLLRMDFVKDYPDDTELLEDVIIENKQAIEMSNIYRDILSGTMDAFASVISNNLNIVMKVLAAVTIILTIPSIIFGLWGSNVPVPFESSPYGFFAIIGIAALCTAVAVVVMVRKKWL